MHAQRQLLLRFRCNSLETELGLKEDQVLKRLTGLIGGHRLELILHQGLESHLRGCSALGGLHLLLSDPSLAVESFTGESVPGRDNVAIVHILDERLHSLSLSGLSLRHSLGDGKGSLLDTHDKSVTVRSSLCSVIEDLYDHGLLTSLTSLGEDNDSSGFDAKENNSYGGISK
jgi:hypothetical protein